MKIIVAGLATDYLDEGKGKTILLLHGWGVSASAYDNLAERLCKRFRVVRLNLPGFGGTEKPNGAWGIEEYAQYVRQFCEKLELTPDSIIGHSMGGQIAVYLVGHQMITIKKLILIGAAAVRPQLGIRELTIQAVAKIGKATIGRTPLASRARKRLYQAAGTEEYLQAGEMQSIYRRIIAQDQSREAASITCPTLLIWGTEDQDTPIDRGRLLQRTIPHARLVAYENAGHFVFTDKAAEVQQTIEDFLA